MLRRALTLVGFSLLCLAAYLLLAPVPVDPVVWQAPVAPAYAGAHAPNTRLAGLRRIPLDGEVGPEHVRVGPDGKLYTSVASGAILRMGRDGEHLERWVNTGGRPLGFDFDSNGRMVAADGRRGLLAIDADGRLDVLADSFEGSPILYANSVVVARGGIIYFTDSSRRFSPGQWGGTLEASVLDILEHSATGRVLALDPVTREIRTVLRDLCYANGIALSADETTLFVAETGEYRIWQVEVGARDVSAKTPGTGARVLLQNLPGFPDNLMRGANGRIWVGFAKPRSPVIDRMAGTPFLRRVTLRLPRRLWPVPPEYGHVIAFDEGGKIVADLQDPSGAYPETTGVTEWADRLYVHSLHARVLAWLPGAAALNRVGG